MIKSKITKMCLAGIFTALVFVFTAYLHIPSYTGYVHVGDAFIYLAATMLPTPYSAFVGFCGALLADCLTGFAMWAPCSAFVKISAVMCFSRSDKKIINKRNVTALIPSFALCVGGYYLYEAILTGNYISPTAGILGNVTQSTLSSIIFVLLGITLDKIHIKDRLFLK